MDFIQLSVQNADKFYYTDNLPISEALGYGLPFSLFGFGTVFVVLLLLWFVVWVFGKVFNRSTKKADTAKKAKLPEIITDETSKTVTPVNNDIPIVAAIIAAISAFRASIGQNVGGFRVVSFKKRK